MLIHGFNVNLVQPYTWIGPHVLTTSILFVYERFDSCKSGGITAHNFSHHTVIYMEKKWKNKMLKMYYVLCRLL